MTRIEAIMRTAPVIPVLVIEDAAHARPIAEALVAGGLKVLEVTLRTAAALDVIREMTTVEGAIVGAGTVLNEADLRASLDAGAEFIVSPGLTEPLGHFKFFPASTSGGLPALKGLAGLFGGVKFCTTGGISLENAPDWLAAEPVLCVGGSWVVGKGVPNVAAITKAAAQAAALAS